MLRHWFKATIKRGLPNIEKNIMVEDNGKLIASFSLFSKD
jgi:hypothetical protein